MLDNNHEHNVDLQSSFGSLLDTSLSSSVQNSQHKSQQVAVITSSQQQKTPKNSDEEQIFDLVVCSRPPTYNEVEESV